MIDENDRESKRSNVRICVTYGAALFLFAGGAVFIAALGYNEMWTEAKDLFMTILPVSAAIISYWFAGRKPKKEPSNDEHGKDDDGGDDK